MVSGYRESSSGGPPAADTAEGALFSSMVGQHMVRAALLLNVVDPFLGGVLIRGEPGTGKSTAVRAMRALLPPIEVVSDCDFNCDPAAAELLCPDCRHRREALQQLPVRRRPVPLVTLPIGATEDRLLGTLDLEAALHKGQRRLSPGLLAEVHRGFLYVDEVNLAPDHLLDAILDAASSGIHRIERDGLSAAHPARFSLIGTMNPGEGGLRPQILDRFGLSVDVEPILDPRLRASLLSRRVGLERYPERRSYYRALDQRLAELTTTARSTLSSVTYETAQLSEIAELTSTLGIASHRADLVVLRTAIAAAALAQREAIAAPDLALASVLALNHRTADPQTLLASVAARWSPDRILRSPSDLLHATGETWHSLLTVGDPAPEISTEADKHPPSGPGSGGQSDWSGGVLSGAVSGVQAVAEPAGDAPAPWLGPAEPITGDPSLTGPLRLAHQQRSPVTEAPLVTRAGAGAAVALEAEGPVGGVAHRRWSGPPGRLAIVATIVAAVLRLRPSGAATAPLLPLRLRPGDVVRVSRRGRPRIALVLVLDASWSMAIDGTFARARAVLAGLLGATRRGDRVALVVAGGDRARIAVPFSRYTEPVIEVVRSLRARGRTPLVDGIRQALSLCTRRWTYTGCATPAVLVLTDGRQGLRDLAASATLSPPGLGVPGAMLMLRDAEVPASLRRLAGQLGWQTRVPSERGWW